MHSNEERPVCVKHYDTMSEEERGEFQKAVEEGGEVDSDGLSERMKHARLLAYAAFEQGFLGVGGLKQPAGSYLGKVSRLSGYDLSGYCAELGWVYVTPEARGMRLASRIAEALSSSYEKGIFATTRSDNVHMQSILLKLGFARVGNEYRSVEHSGKKIQAWVLSR